MARPKGAPQVKPTNTDLQDYYKLLKQKAAAGDVNAAGWLVVAHNHGRHVSPGESK